jgi:hypothetical protein
LWGIKKVVNAARHEDSIFYNVPDEHSQSANVAGYDAGPIEREYESERNKRDDSSSVIAGIVYWISLFAAIIGNFIISVILIPFLLMLENKLSLYIVVMVMGLVFGALFNFLLTDIHRLDYRHHVISGAVIPALAVINVYIMVEVSKTVGTIISVTVNQNAFVISIIYVAMFIVPYILTMILRNYKVVRLH